MSEENRTEQAANEDELVEPPTSEAAAEGPASDEDVERSAEEADAANPAAIAKRVAALGEGDANEELAREEERKLAERRAAAGPKKAGTKKKRGLEASASKRLAEIGKRAEPHREVALAVDADPLIERTVRLGDWIKRHQKAVQLVGAVLAVALIGTAAYLYREQRRNTEASAVLAKAVEAQRATVLDGKKKHAHDDEEDEAQELTFDSYDARRNAAEEKYREVQTKYAGTGAAMLAKLAEGSLLLDKGDHAGALAAFADVSRSPLALADVEVKARALEGTGFANELAATAQPAERDKFLDAALAAYKELENTGDAARGFKELAMYHQARVLMAKGDRDKAKELLSSLKERVNRTEAAIAPGLPAPPSFPYLKEVAMDRLRSIDPDAVPSTLNPNNPNSKMSQEQMQRLLEQLRQRGGGQGEDLDHGGEH